MRFDRFLMVVTLLVCAALVSGCASVERMKVTVPWLVSPEERDFAAAMKHLKSGNEIDARDLLERTVSARPLAGLTDEALFRLALLYLRDEGGKGELRARTHLKRLISEFPDSIWAKQAAPLYAYLQQAFTLRTGHKNLRNQNLSLGRDNKEMRQSIERLKQLDLELEQKIRR